MHCQIKSLQYSTFLFEHFASLEAKNMAEHISACHAFKPQELPGSYPWSKIVVNGWLPVLSNAASKLLLQFKKYIHCLDVCAVIHSTSAKFPCHCPTTEL